MIHVDTVLVKLASRCNLDCSYCYVYHMGDHGWRSQPKKMSLGTVRLLGSRLAELARDQGRGFPVVFHGGEPLLVGPKGFDDICAELRAALPRECGLSMQTNGVLLSDQIVESCVRHNVSVSVSLDGPAVTHDRYRTDSRGRPTHERVVAGIRRLTATPAGRELFSGVLAVVDLGSDPIEVYETLKATGAPRIDFLYRDGNHDTLPTGKTALASTEYGGWMVRLLDYYIADRRPTPIRVLDEMLKLLLGGVSTKEGLGNEIFGIVVIETDGTISKNDTLKSAYDTADRFNRAFSLDGGPIRDVLESVDFGEYHRSERPSSTECAACPYLHVCGGGMLAHRWSTERQFDNPSVFCSDQICLIDAMRAHLLRRGLAA